MIPKWFVWFCVIIGSTAGAYLPMLWGSDVLSVSSVIFSGIGGLLGIWVAVKVGNFI
ncbi:MAG TPA: hypothetical protein VF817_03880 [Patescibacteria group bacterium]